MEDGSRKTKTFFSSTAPESSPLKLLFVNYIENGLGWVVSEARAAATELTPTSQEQVQVRGLQGTRQRALSLPGVRPRGRCATANHAAQDAPSLGTISIISYIQNNAQTA